ncbi:MAG: VPS10 domain-containing protein [Blastocatellia bacterium]
MNRPATCRFPFIMALCLFLFTGLATAQTQETKPAAPQTPAAPAKPDPMSTGTFAGLRLRSIGPALTSGRVNGFAVDPHDRAKYYVTVASGGVWKTVNGGTTWTSVFDNEGSYSIGHVALDPKNSATVWVGAGEHNAQRAIGYGDGVYRSDDGGRSWKNMGLKKSEHIGRIVIDPRDSNVIYVAAQGPLWGPGGDRGLYKSTDGGKTWKAVLTISENTGVTDVALDPRDPDVIYAASWQRRRHVWTLINGGPESAIHKSTDGGATWTKLRVGPPGDMGRIGIAISPVNPDVVFATVEAASGGSGIFRSQDRGATWEKMSGFIAQGMYYGQIICDPKNVDRVYMPNVIFQVSDDGGRTFRALGEKSKHVDNHAIWIDPKNTDYYLVGSDGGVYESHDRGANWHFKSNLPVTQFYDVAVDNAAPFYNICGGTQDNYSMCGPSRTRDVAGANNSHWIITNGGDGFVSRIDPVDPNIIYAESQYGGLVRFDKRSGERTGIQPQPGKGEAALRWNWDSPLIISPHLNTRIYFAANKLFRSDDRGDTWKAISGDLTRQIDRDSLPVMGKLWGPEAVARHQSTSQYGNITALSESPKKEGLLYAGTDDGLIQVTENNGGAWRKIETFPGVPEKTFVARVLASQHNEKTVYALFNNHKSADYKPYVLKSTDAGVTWNAITANLPENGPVWAIAEDHVNPDLLFAGTEFGLFFSNNGGQKWVQLKGGMPTIPVRDLAIQKRENDLVAATFGRGFYVLDNYAALRGVSPEILAKEAELFPVRDALMYVPSQLLGGRGKAFMGESFYTADNPPFGATFTYYLKEALKTRKQKRQDAEREAARKNETPKFPTMAELRAEDEEEAPAIMLTISDAGGRVVRRLTGAAAPGMNRVSWDLRDPASSLSQGPPSAEAAIFADPPGGPLVMPGKYSVTLSKRVAGVVTQIAGPQSFTVVADGAATLAAADRGALTEFQQKATRLQRAVTGSMQTAGEIKARLALIKRALLETPAADAKLMDTASALDQRMNDILRELRGDMSIASREGNPPPSISQRVGSIMGQSRSSTSKPTQTQMDQYRIASAEFETVLTRLRTLAEGDLAKLEKALEAAGAPWTPGRIPVWNDK